MGANRRHRPQVGERTSGRPPRLRPLSLPSGRRIHSLGGGGGGGGGQEAFVKKRAGIPWIPAEHYGALLPEFTINLVVRDINASLTFYTEVLQATVHYADPDFAAVRILGLELMLHADHAYEHHPWSNPLKTDAKRGLGAELRLLGVDPYIVAERARPRGALLREARTRGHGWREAMVSDPDGYVWAVGDTQLAKEAQDPLT